LPGQQVAFSVQQGLPPMEAGVDMEKSDVARRAKTFAIAMSSFQERRHGSRAGKRREATSRNRLHPEIVFEAEDREEAAQARGELRPVAGRNE
jgi:hypothetical protein